MLGLSMILWAPPVLCTVRAAHGWRWRVAPGSGVSVSLALFRDGGLTWSMVVRSSPRTLCTPRRVPAPLLTMCLGTVQRWVYWHIVRSLTGPRAPIPFRITVMWGWALSSLLCWHLHLLLLPCQSAYGGWPGVSSVGQSTLHPRVLYRVCRRVCLPMVARLPPCTVLWRITWWPRLLALVWRGAGPRGHIVTPPNSWPAHSHGLGMPASRLGRPGRPRALSMARPVRRPAMPHVFMTGPVTERAGITGGSFLSCLK